MFGFVSSRPCLDRIGRGAHPGQERYCRLREGVRMDCTALWVYVGNVIGGIITYHVLLTPSSLLIHTHAGVITRSSYTAKHEDDQEITCNHTATETEVYLHSLILFWFSSQKSSDRPTRSDDRAGGPVPTSISREVLRLLLTSSSLWITHGYPTVKTKDDHDDY